MKTKLIQLLCTAVLLSAYAPFLAAQNAFQFINPETHGFIETRGGYRLCNDPNEKDMSVMETRLQFECANYNDMFDFKYKADAVADMVIEEIKYDTRELWLFIRLNDYTDLKLGRQTLTWGTGDLVFLNDLFPKDWQSFFIGRDAEYLKAPSEAIKLSFFAQLANIDIVYTPSFDADRYVSRRRLSHWNSKAERISGNDAVICANNPDEYFRDDELALRIYKNISNYEYALYAYFGYWKTPSGSTPDGENIFPQLNVYGASLRGSMGKGIANAEIAYYDSHEDKDGNNPMIRNPEMRYLLGYTQDLAMDFNLSVQYYVEHILCYDNYKQTLSDTRKKDRLRHVLTIQAVKLVMNQNLELAVPMYYSPSDEDAYLRPRIKYKHTDQLSCELGANIFFGNDKRTFFAQFEKNTNLYTSIKYCF